MTWKPPEKLRLQEEAEKHGQEWDVEIEELVGGEWFYAWCVGGVKETSKDPTISNCKIARNLWTLSLNGGRSQTIQWFPEIDDFVFMDLGPRPAWADPAQIELL